MIHRCASLNDNPIFIEVLFFYFIYIYIYLFLHFILNIFRLWPILFINIYKANSFILFNYLFVVLAVSMLHVNKCENFFAHQHTNISVIVSYEKMYITTISMKQEQI